MQSSRSGDGEKTSPIKRKLILEPQLLEYKHKYRHKKNNNKDTVKTNVRVASKSSCLILQQFL